MSEGSLPFFAALRSRLALRLLHSRAGAAVSRLFARNELRTTAVPAALESRAAGLVRDYLRAQATNLERAERLGERADRLEEAGIPSESARNRAERAREEVRAGLAALRGRFVEANGDRDGARAFDRVVDLFCPVLKPLH